MASFFVFLLVPGTRKQQRILKFTSHTLCLVVVSEPGEFLNEYRESTAACVVLRWALRVRRVCLLRTGDQIIISCFFNPGLRTPK